MLTCQIVHIHFDQERYSDCSGYADSVRRCFIRLVRSHKYDELRE